MVPIRDRADRLDRLLDGLDDLPVVVVDDASRDPGAVAAVAARHGARLLVLTTNVGPAGARNAGIAEVRTPYVAFVDSDVVVDADSLRGLAGHFVDPRVAAVGPRVQGVARSARAAPVRALGRRRALARPGRRARAGAAVVEGRLAAERLPGGAGRGPGGRAPSTRVVASVRTSTSSGG